MGKIIETTIEVPVKMKETGNGVTIFYQDEMANGRTKEEAFENLINWFKAYKKSELYTGDY